MDWDVGLGSGAGSGASASPTSGSAAVKTDRGGTVAKAVQITEGGGPEVVRVTEVPDPTPGAGDLLVDVAAAGVNYVDTYHRDGTYPMDLPIVLGVEGAGQVRAVGADVTAFAEGDRVAWALTPGSYASVAAVPQAHAVKGRGGVSDGGAARIALRGMTARMLTRSVSPIADGDTVLVH